MIKSIFIWLTVILTIILFGSCKMGSKKKNIPYNKMNTLSKVKLPIKIEKENFIKLIDSYLPDTIFEGSEEDGFKANIKVLKGKLNNIDFVDKTMNINLSLYVEVEKKVLFIPTKTVGEIDLDLYSQLDIDKDWQLRTNTSLVDYQWIKRPIINISGYNISDFGLTNKLIDSKKMEWMRDIDSFIANKDFLKESVGTIVKKFNSPFPLDSLGIVGLKITPKKINLYPFKSDAKNIEGVIEFIFKSDLVTNSRFEKANDYYPDFSWQFEDDTIQNITISLTTDEAQLQNIIDDYMFVQPQKDREIDLDGDTITIEKVNVLIDNEKVGGNVVFSGDKNGKIKLVSRPVWNYKKDRLDLVNSDVDISMKGFGTNVLLALFGRKAKKILVKKTEEQLNSLIKEVLLQTNNVFETSKYKNTLQIVNFSMPMQVEEGFLLTDIHFNMEGEIDWEKVNIKFPVGK